MACDCMKATLEAVRKDHGDGQFHNSTLILNTDTGNSTTRWPSLTIDIPVPRKDGKGMRAKGRKLCVIAQRCPICGAVYDEDRKTSKGELAGMLARNRDVLVDLLSEVIGQHDAELMADRIYTLEQQTRG